jgi:hypothetical protein
MREFFAFGLTHKMTLAYPNDLRTDFNIIDESIIRGKNGAGGATDEWGCWDEEYLEGDEGHELSARLLGIKEGYCTV